MFPTPALDEACPLSGFSPQGLDSVISEEPSVCPAAGGRELTWVLTAQEGSPQGPAPLWACEGLSQGRLGLL